MVRGHRGLLCNPACNKSRPRFDFLRRHGRHAPRLESDLRATDWRIFDLGIVDRQTHARSPEELGVADYLGTPLGWSVFLAAD